MDLKQKVEADLEALKAKAHADELRVADYTKTFWAKYGLYVSIVISIVFGLILGKVT
jgi:hypothetical protein